MTINVLNDHPTQCDLGYPDAEPCGRPVTYYALVASPAGGWTDDALPVSLGGYCCLHHAEAELRPSREDAEAMYLDVADCCGGPQYAPAAWKLLVDAYPRPIHVSEVVTLELLKYYDTIEYCRSRLLSDGRDPDSDELLGKLAKEACEIEEHLKVILPQ